MNSFNAFGQTAKKFGGNTPVWLGTVKPIPVGAVLGVSASAAEYPVYIPAGTPVLYVAEGKTFTAWDGTTGTPNGYLYNDIYVESQPEGTDVIATGAIVMYHAEGLLIDRTGFGDKADALQAAIPGVLLVKDAE
jgi:hypothetical protein